MQKDDICQQVNTVLPLGNTPALFRISMFDGCRDKHPKAKKATWARLCEVLTEHKPGDKDGAAISPSVFDGTRANENVVSTALAVFDVDAGSSFDAVLSAAKNAGVALALYSSYSHGDPAKPGDRFRAVVPLSREVVPAEFPAVRGAVAQALGIEADPATKALAQLYYLPRYHPDRKHLARAEVIDGQAVDVDAVLAALADVLPVQRNGSVTNADLSAGFAYARKSIEEVRQMLLCIPATVGRFAGYLTAVWGVRAALGDEGLELVLEWARGDLHPDQPRPEKWKGDADVKKDWNSDKRKGVGVGSLVRLAEKYGYRPTAATVAGSNTEAGPDLRDVVDGTLGDVANGKVVAAMLRGRYFKLPGGKNWVGFTSERGHIRIPEGGELRLAKQLPAVLAANAAKIMSEDAEKGQKAMQHALASSKLPRIQAAIALAETEDGITVNHAEIDPHGPIIGAQNGLLNALSGELRPFDAGQIILRRLSVSFDPNATAPRFVNEVLPAILPEREKRDMVQQLAGAALAGLPIGERLDLWVGSRGGEGKSTLLNTIAGVFGTYAVALPGSVFLESYGASKGATPELTHAVGARLFCIGEIGDRARLNASIVKAFTGGDPVLLRDLYAAAFEYQFRGWAVMPVNEPPDLNANDGGLKRRVWTTHFTQVQEQAEHGLAGKLVRDEGSGILNWLLAGAQAFNAGRFRVPERVRADSAAYIDEHDSLKHWMTEHTAQGGPTSADDLYRAYRAWAANSGHIAMTKAKLGRRLGARGVPRCKDAAGNSAYGLALNERGRRAIGAI